MTFVSEYGTGSIARHVVWTWPAEQEEARSMPVDTSVIGKSTGTQRVVVERQPLSNFAKAVKDTNPIYFDPRAAKTAGFDAIPAPPTWSFAMAGWGTYPELQGDLSKVQANPMFEIIGKLQAKGGLVLHGEQEFEYHRPILAGDVLVGEGKVTEAYEKETGSALMTFVVSETTWMDDKTGEPVVTTRFNLIHRAPKA
jgi:acyl dehydratase